MGALLLELGIVRDVGQLVTLAHPTRQCLTLARGCSHWRTATVLFAEKPLVSARKILGRLRHSRQFRSQLQNPQEVHPKGSVFRRDRKRMAPGSCWTLCLANAAPHLRQTVTMTIEISDSCFYHVQLSE